MVSVFARCLSRKREHSLQTQERFLSVSLTGDVFCIVCAADAHEHAAGVSLHRDRGSWRAAVQLLPSLVRRHLPGQRAVQHPLSLPGPQAGTRETHGPLMISSCL